MLKHHYKTVPDKLFITLTEEGESKYSQEFISESHQKNKTQMDEESDDYSDDAYDEHTN